MNQPVKQNGTNMLLRTLRLPKLLIKNPFYLAFCVLLFTFCLPVEAQQKRQPRIGVLLALPHSAIADRIEAFRQGLREIGYTEGKTIAIEYRYADGKFDRLADLAADLARLKVESSGKLFS